MQVVLGKKFDCTKSSVVEAHVNDLWPLVTDIARWPGWMRDARGHGLAKAEKVADEPGRFDPHARTTPAGARWRFEFTNGLRGEWEITYWLDPAQVSLRLRPESRQDSHGVEHWIFDLDLFPRGPQTQLWFGALLMMEPKVRPGRLARWPAKDVLAWVEGFHDHVAQEAAKLPKGKAALVAERERR
jgi:hypothetical protein